MMMMMMFLYLFDVSAGPDTSSIFSLSRGWWSCESYLHNKPLPMQSSHPHSLSWSWVQSSMSAERRMYDASN